MTRHARKLLTVGHLTQLGVFFAQFPDFQAVSWLRKEKDRAGQVQDFVWAVQKIHEEFLWPWPGESRAESEAGSSRLVEDNLRQLYINTGGGGQETDSGYLSHQTVRPDRQSQSSLLTVEAMLRIKEGHGHVGSIASDEGDLGSVSGIQSPVTATPRDTASDSGAVTRAEAQLTFLLHLLLEAECLDWAGCLAVVLRDVMAIIRIISMARASSEDSEARLQQGLQALCDSLSQYSHFLGSVRPHITGLSQPPPASLSPPSLSSQPQLSRSLSDPGTERIEQAARREAAEREAERPRAVTPSPGQGQELAKPRQEEEEEEEEDDAGCRVM